MFSKISIIDIQQTQNVRDLAEQATVEKLKTGLWS